MVKTWKKWACTVCTLIQTAVFAQSNEAVDVVVYLPEGPYVKIGAGYAWSSRPNATCADSAVLSKPAEARKVHVSNPYPLEVGIGYRFNQRMRLEASYSYRGRIHYRLDGAAGSSASSRLNNMTATLNVYCDFPLDPYSPYIGFGIGCSMNKSDRAYWRYSLASDRLEGGDRSINVAYVAMFGIQQILNDRWVLDLGGRLSELGSFRNSGRFNSETGTPIRFDKLRTAEIMINLIYHIW